MNDTATAQANSEMRRRLKALVVSRGLTDRQMADGIGTTLARMRGILDGRKPLTAAELLACAKHLGVLSSHITGEILFDADASVA